MKKSNQVIPAMILAAAAAIWMHPVNAGGDPVPVIASGLSSFGIEEPTVIYYPDTATFVNDSYVNIVDEGGGMIRETLRNNYSTLGWWDGDRATTNDDRQRAEVKNLGGTAYQQKTDQTYEYSYDFRTDPDFIGTNHFCHIFQLKATDETGVGSGGSPLVTLSLYKSGSGTQGRLQFLSEDTGSTIIARTFNFVPGQWIHAVIRITTTSSTESNGVVMASINGDAFQGLSGASVYLPGATTYYNKWGFYRGMGVDYGVPPGDSWVEDRTLSLLQGTTNILAWKGGANGNTWDLDTTQNWLNGSTPSIFRTADQVSFTDSTANNSVNILGTVSPNYITVNAAQNYTFSGTGKISGGTLVKLGSGTLTLATSNDYPGLTEVQGGTLSVTGSIGNNSLVFVTGGTLKAGSSIALGTNSSIGTTINGGTLDINGFNLSTEPITVQGAGVGGNGAIINSGIQQTSALSTVTLSGDATFGSTQTPPGGTGFGRWDIRANSGATLSTGGNAYNLTKVGANQVSFVATTVDTALGDININQGFLGFQTSTNGMGDPNKSVTIASGAALEFYSTTNAMNKKCVLNGGTIWGESGSGSQNTFSGPITVNSTGGVFDAGGGLTGGAPKSSAVLTISGAISGAGGVTKNGPGTVFITGTPGYLGSTAISAGTLQINSGAAVTLHAISGAGALGVDNTTSLTAESINIGMLTIGAGSTITIAPIPGGPLAGVESMQTVPEPVTWTMLVMAAMGLGIYWRRSR
ncbi:MAG: autotransporter-associated beta strand repeat-containing protein [Thermoguttaceae bacterium]